MESRFVLFFRIHEPLHASQTMAMRNISVPTSANPSTLQSTAKPLKNKNSYFPNIFNMNETEKENISNGLCTQIVEPTFEAKPTFHHQAEGFDSMFRSNLFEQSLPIGLFGMLQCNPLKPSPLPVEDHKARS